jgi:hypothetical protein
VWFRLRRAVENTPTILVLLTRESQAKTCASLVLRLEAEPVCRIAMPDICDPAFFRSPWACLLDGFEVRAERIRSRVQSVTDAYGDAGAAPVIADGRTSTFKTRALWSYFSRDALCAADLSTAMRATDLGTALSADRFKQCAPRSSA